MARALREIVGTQKVGAEGVAAALATGAPRTLQVLRELIDRVIASQPADGLDEGLWGKAPTDADLAKAESNADAAHDAALKRFIADALTREQAAKRLGISAQAVSKRTSGDQLIALRYAGRSLYPRWQFSDDGPLPELNKLRPQFPSALSLTTWVTTPTADLDGNTPAEMLGRRDGRRRVLELAQAISAEAW